jgi:hypothetical protein
MALGTGQRSRGAQGPRWRATTTVAVGVEQGEWLWRRPALGGGLERRLRGRRPYAALAIALPWRLVWGVSRRRLCVCGRRHPLMVFFSTKGNTVFLLHH